MRIASLILFAGACVVPAVANAQATETESRLIASFTAICLEHMGDSSGQTATATSPPWNFSAGGPTTGPGILPYHAGSTRLGIGEAAGSCTLTSEMEPSVTLTSMRSAMTAAIGTDDGQPLQQADSRYWLIAGDNDEQCVLALKVSNATGRNLATLWVQRRASLSQQN